ncbi:MAG: hypothetical protein HY428_00225 [Candidatus Levybacteria bacterium]|nr:hypothetical protein [Candidatus Levybacteria bacterium]
MKRYSRKKSTLQKIPPSFLLLGIPLLAIFLLVVLRLTGRLDFSSSAAAPRVNAELWVQDSNSGESGGVLLDFKQQFEQPELWAAARQNIDVYQFHDFLFMDPKYGIDETYIREKMLPVLNESGIKIALNVTGANWAKCDDRDQIKYKEAEAIDRIIAAGGAVSFLTMQSTLSKTEGGNSVTLNRCSPYPDKRRIDDIIDYMQFMKKRYPNMQFGMTDADATKGNDYKTSLHELRKRLGNHGLHLNYIFIDNIAEFLSKNDPKDLKDLEQFIRQDLNIPFGLVYTADKDITKSNAAYHTRVLRRYTEYFKAGGRPNNYLVTSWFRFPTRYLPDNDPREYTLMRTAAALGNRIRGTGD